MLFLTVFPFFNYLQRCSEIQELSQNTFLWQSVLPIDGCCEDLEVSSVKWLKDRLILPDRVATNQNTGFASSCMPGDSATE